MEGWSGARNTEVRGCRLSSRALDPLRNDWDLSWLILGPHQCISSIERKRMEQESLDVQVGSPSPFFPCVPLHLQTVFQSILWATSVSWMQGTLDAAQWWCKGSRPKPLSQWFGLQWVDTWPFSGDSQYVLDCTAYDEIEYDRVLSPHHPHLFWAWMFPLYIYIHNIYIYI